MLFFSTVSKNTLLFLLVCIFFSFSGCYNSTSSNSSSSKWIKPIDKSIDLTRFRQSTYEALFIEDIEKNPISFINLEKNKEGDKRSHFKSKLFYKIEAYPQFRGIIELNYVEIPFYNQYVLILKISNSLKDKEDKRTREFLSQGNSESYLVLTHDSQPEIKDVNPSQKYSLYWDSQKENSGYAAFLSPSEFSQLRQTLSSEENSRLHLSFGNSQYDISSLKKRLLQDFSLITQSIQEKQNINDISLKRQSTGINNYYEFFSPWFAIDDFFMKIGALYSYPNNSFNEIQLILGSYDPDILRKIFSGNSFLVFSADQKIFLLDLKKMNFYNSLQQKESSLLSFSLIENEPEELRKNSNNWEKSPKQFWQINLKSQALSISDLKTILSISQSPVHNLSLSFSENLNFTQGKWLIYFLDLIKGLTSNYENNSQSQ